MAGGVNAPRTGHAESAIPRKSRHPGAIRRFPDSPWRTIIEAGQPWTRRLGALGLMIAVVVVHGCLAETVTDRMVDISVEAAMPQRIEVAYVREMEINEPPRFAPAAPLPPVARAPAKAPRAKPAASAASEAQQAPEPEPVVAQVEPAASAPAPEASEAVAAAASVPLPQQVAQAASQPLLAASVPSSLAAASPAAPAGSAPAFAWPGSTRLSYVLTGNYRGEIHGSAQVEWVRVGSRYQVHLDVYIGMPAAPLMKRNLTSEGLLTPEGLYPERFDQLTKVAFRDAQRQSVRFELDGIILADGKRRDRLAGVQDTASQFVQLSYVFTTRPELLRTGGMVEFPLALPRNVDRYVYDILEQEPVYTPFGAVDAFHLKPRRVARRGSDLVAEVWYAPTLAYLPVRIKLTADADTFIDLVIRRKPELSAQ